MVKADSRVDSSTVAAASNWLSRLGSYWMVNAASREMIHQWNLTIPPLTGDEPRRAYVYLPDSFQEDPSLRYPVLWICRSQLASQCSPPGMIRKSSPIRFSVSTRSWWRRWSATTTRTTDV